MEIRPLKKTDLPIRVEWMNDERIYSSMHFDIPVLLDNTELWFIRIQNRQDRSDVAFIEDDVVVAMGGLTSIDNVVKKAELYIFVNPTSKGKGLGTKATRLLCEYGFMKLGLNKIYLYTNESNIAAQHVYERCGFTLEGRLRKETTDAKGVLIDRLYYGIFQNELKNE